MTEKLQQSFDAVDSTNAKIAAYVQSNSDDWQDGENVLSTVKSAAYATGLKESWSELNQEEKQNFFSAIESAVAAQPTEPVTSETRDDVSTIWCTGFLELLTNYLDDKSLPHAEVEQYLGPASKAYMQSWNEFSGIAL